MTLIWRAIALMVLKCIGKYLIPQWMYKLEGVLFSTAPEPVNSSPTRFVCGISESEQLRTLGSVIILSKHR